MSAQLTFINWTGNKSKHVPLIKKMLPHQFNTYYEPFLGSGALYIGLQPPKAVLADNDYNLINVWQTIINEPEHFIAVYKSLLNELFWQETILEKQKKLTIIKQQYYILLDRFNDNKLDKTTQGALFLLLINYAFRGNFNYKEGKLVVHFGWKEKTPESHFNDDMVKNLQNIKSLIKINNSTILHSDFEFVIIKPKKETLFFVTPLMLLIMIYKTRNMTNIKVLVGTMVLLI